MIQIGLYDNSDNLILDTTPYAVSANMSNSKTGYEVLNIKLSLPATLEAMVLNDARVHDVIATHQHGGVVWQGRLSGRSLSGNELELSADGGFSAYRDDFYTAIFSTSRYKDWTQAGGEDSAPSGQNFAPEQWQMDNNSRLYIAPLSGSTYSGNGNAGTWRFEIPDKGRNHIKHISLDYEVRLPSLSWTFYIVGETAAGLQAVELASAGIGSVVSGSYSSTSISLDLVVLYVMIEYDAMLGTTITQETGHYYGKATNLAITYDDGTVYADDIVSDVALFMSGVNSGQASGSSVLIKSPAINMSDEIFEDVRCDRVLKSLADEHGYEVGVWDGKLLHFREKGSSNNTYHIRRSIPKLQYGLKSLRNSAYCAYQDENGVTQRTDTATDAASQARYGLRRRSSVSSRSPALATAETLRDDEIESNAAVAPRADMGIGRLYSPYGQRVCVSFLRHGDVLVVENLSPLFTLQEEARAVVVNPRLDLMTGGLQFSIGLPPPSVETIIADLANRS